MTDKREMTALNSSAATDERQSLHKSCKNSIMHCPLFFPSKQALYSLDVHQQMNG